MRFLITAGPTREPIDPVRYISNRSSGKMGYAIAETALAEGHHVTLISGPVTLEAPRDAQLISVLTSDEMFEAVHHHADQFDICVLCAAVADYKPANVSSTKIKKHGAKFSLELIPHARHSRFVRPPARPPIPSRRFRCGNRSRGRKCREEAARKELRHHRCKRCQRRKFGNGERRE